MAPTRLPSVSWADAAREGLAAGGLDPTVHRVEEIQRMRLLSGEELRRYRVWRDVGDLEAPLVDDSLTLVREPGGEMLVQVGVLPISAEPASSLPSAPVRRIAERRFMEACATDLKRLSGALDPIAVRGLPNVRSLEASADPAIEAHLAQVTREAFRGVKPRWVIRDGDLELRFETDTMRYFASVDDAGQVQRMERRAPIACGCVPHGSTPVAQTPRAS